MRFQFSSELFTGSALVECRALNIHCGGLNIHSGALNIHCGALVHASDRVHTTSMCRKQDDGSRFLGRYLPPSDEDHHTCGVVDALLHRAHHVSHLYARTSSPHHPIGHWTMLTAL
eukprot:5087032-Pyramimonas_sp.AAC.1